MKIFVVSGLLLVSLSMLGCSADDDDNVVATNEGEESSSQEVVTATEFKQDLLSSNPWYQVGIESWYRVGTENETNNDAGVCQGTFTYAIDGTVNIKGHDERVPMNITATYSITDGNLVLTHKGESLISEFVSDEGTYLDTLEAGIDDQGNPNEAHIRYYLNKQEAIDFASSIGLDCSYKFPE
jgi:hypothetical protein